MKRLHLGCFDKAVDGWVNTDVTPHLWVARVPFLAQAMRATGRLSEERAEQHRRGVFRKVRFLNVSKRFPFADNTFEAVFTSHMLEHLFLDQARSCVSEALRVLAPGGVLRIAVPDLDLLIARYRPEDADAWAEGFFQVRDQAEGRHQHHWMYNETSLRALLLDVGFSKVVRTSYRQGACPDLEILDNRPESLFVEAFK
ncbi:MAG TPA: methyltransferase domain-containing protein [Longimicrobium sp.]